MIIIYPLCCIHRFLSFLAFWSSRKTKTHVSEHSCRLQGRECAHASLHKSSISSLSSLPPSPIPPTSLPRPASLGPLPLKTTRFFWPASCEGRVLRHLAAPHLGSIRGSRRRTFLPGTNDELPQFFLLFFFYGYPSQSCASHTSHALARERIQKWAWPPAR